MSTGIKERVLEAVKDAMRARAKQRLGALRGITAEFKRVEVDERVEIDDTRALAILDKMTKQRKDSLAQYQNAGRQDLADQEAFELAVIDEFLPAALTAEELAQLVDSAIAETNAASMQDMGSVMAALRPKVQGRADMGEVSGLVKAKLA
ncbi:MAG: GatB/YqeY domain-containing protein [Pseudomonadota bacterium]